MDSYSLSRTFWNFSFANPEKIKPTHISIYFFAIEHCNRLGWKNKFGLPASMVIEAIGIKSYSVYKKSFDELVDFGFFEVIEYSKNQWSSTIIALKENNKAHNKAHNKALDKALIKHGIKQPIKQSESTEQSTDSIDKPLTNKPLTINKEQVRQYVFLLKSEIESLDKEFSKEDCEWMYDKLNDYKLSKGAKYKSDYGAICSWVKKSLKEEKEKNSAKKESKIDAGLKSHEEALRILNGTK